LNRFVYYLKIAKMIDVKKIKKKVEERRKISNEAFLDMMGSLEEMKKHGPKKAARRHV
jgi:hypothetical protein